jgi:hypothetical protein
MAAMLENHMVVGEYEPNWVDATAEDFELRVSEIEDELCNERRLRLIDELHEGGVFVETVVNILMSSLSREDKLSELQDALDHEVTALAKWLAEQE